MEEKHRNALGFSIIMFAIFLYMGILDQYPKRDLEASILAMIIFGLLCMLAVTIMDGGK